MITKDAKAKYYIFNSTPNEMKLKERLGREVDDKRKFEYHYTALSKELRIETNLIIYNTEGDKI